jgi:hypothetical protein
MTSYDGIYMFFRCARFAYSKDNSMKEINRVMQLKGPKVKLLLG